MKNNAATTHRASGGTTRRDCNRRRAQYVASLGRSAPRGRGACEPLPAAPDAFARTTERAQRLVPCFRPTAGSAVRNAPPARLLRRASDGSHERRRTPFNAARVQLPLGRSAAAAAAGRREEQRRAPGTAISLCWFAGPLKQPNKSEFVFPTRYGALGLISGAFRGVAVQPLRSAGEDNRLRQRTLPPVPALRRVSTRLSTLHAPVRSAPRGRGAFETCGRRSRTRWRGRHDGPPSDSRPETRKRRQHVGFSHAELHARVVRSAPAAAARSKPAAGGAGRVSAAARTSPL